MQLILMDNMFFSDLSNDPKQRRKHTSKDSQSPTDFFFLRKKRKETSKSSCTGKNNFPEKILSYTNLGKGHGATENLQEQILENMSTELLV